MFSRIILVKKLSICLQKYSDKQMKLKKSIIFPVKMRWVWLLCAFLVPAEGAHAQTLTFEGDFEMEPENNTTETSQGAVKSNESVDETSTARTERTPIKLPIGGVLYPRASENRDVKSLDGLWHFKLDSMDQEGLKEQWFDKDISQVSMILDPAHRTYWYKPAKIPPANKLESTQVATS